MKAFMVMLGLLAWAAVAYAELSPDCRQAFKLCQQSRQVAQARQRIDLLRRAVDLCPNVTTHSELGDALLAAGRPQPARYAYDQAYAIAENKTAQARALNGMGQACAALGENVAAVHAWRASYQLQPDMAVKNRLLALESRMAHQVMDARRIERSLTTVNKGFSPEAVAPSVDLRIHFEFDSARLTPAGRRQADELGRALTSTDLSGARFELEGHTDCRGPYAYNLDLSVSRARAVKRYLERNYALPAWRLQAIGMGESQPLYDGDSEREHALNRRVVVRVATD